MNVIAWDRAYSLYPRATLIEHQSLCTRGEEDPGIINKYYQRGWHMLDEEDLLDDEYPAFSTGMRWIGDGKSWTIALAVDGVIPPPPANPRTLALSRDPCAGTAWHLSIDIVEIERSDWGDSDDERMEDNDDEKDEEEVQHKCEIAMNFTVSTMKCFQYGYVHTGYGERDIKREIMTVLRNPIHSNVIREHIKGVWVGSKR